MGNAPTTASTSADHAITTNVVENIEADAALEVVDLHVRTYSGSVILGGKVDSHAHREKAGRLAKATAGVSTVTNQIVVE